MEENTSTSSSSTRLAGNLILKPNESSGNSRSKNTKKTVYHWGNAEVIRWLRKHHTHYYNQYSRVFQEHDLSGRALVRLDPIRMEKMGITNSEHIADLLEHIFRLRLKHEQNELKILQSTHQAAPP
ncbi:protein aveugle-like [Asterias rubens]|uniref:protein aveugle-like n=1 Tax=Asterias rubens TaxID=7604 RepID=UPI00145503D3|nr:protein aveugle-like [Asterias rubens]